MAKFDANRFLILLAGFRLLSTKFMPVNSTAPCFLRRRGKKSWGERLHLARWNINNCVDKSETRLRNADKYAIRNGNRNYSNERAQH